MPQKPTRSKMIDGSNGIKSGAHNPTGKPQNGDAEASAPDPMQSKNLGGPLPDPGKGSKNFTTDGASEHKSLSHPKPSEAMKTGRI